MNFDIFSIFNPEWWMDESNNALQITDSILFLLMAIPVLYLFICALLHWEIQEPIPGS